MEAEVEMNWLNLETKFIRAEEYVGCEPIARATWLNVIVYCAEQENGGRIRNCEMWRDRQWQQTCGVTVEEINKASPLLHWDGDDLVIWNYPADKEREVRDRREASARGGRAKTQVKIDAAKTNGAKSNDVHLGVEPKSNAFHLGVEAQRKEKEKEKEKRKGCGENGDAESSAKPSTASAVDSVWLGQLTTDAAFAGIDVAREIAKARLWADTRRRKFSRRFCLNWLNKVEKPMTSSFVSTIRHSPAASSTEIVGWKQVLDREYPDSVYSAGGEKEARTWAELPIEAQRLIEGRVTT